MKNVIRKKKNIANGVFIFGKFITQSLDELERQIIYFFFTIVSQWAELCMPTSKLHTMFCQTYITHFQSHSWWRDPNTTVLEVEIYLNSKNCSGLNWCFYYVFFFTVWYISKILSLIMYDLYANVFLDVHHEWD